MALKKVKRNIIDGKKFTIALTEYVEEWNRLNPVKVKGKDAIRPKVSNFIGLCIIKLANHLGTKYNFSGYTWKEEMINDGIENFLRYMHNFNPEKTNAHAYTTKIVMNSFIQRIQKEKYQLSIKYKMMSGMTDEHMFEIQENDEGEYVNSYIENMKKIQLENGNYVPEKKVERKKRTLKMVENSLEHFVV
jgi:hypothetical protein